MYAGATIATWNSTPVTVVCLTRHGARRKQPAEALYSDALRVRDSPFSAKMVNFAKTNSFFLIKAFSETRFWRIFGENGTFCEKNASFKNSHFLRKKYKRIWEMPTGGSLQGRLGGAHQAEGCVRRPWACNQLGKQLLCSSLATRIWRLHLSQF